MIGLLGSVIDKWRRLRITSARYKQLRYYSSQSDVPDTLRRRSIAIVGSPSTPKWAILECPCGRGHRIAINLSMSRQPHWSVQDDPDGITITPSIDSTTYGCHYSICHGRTKWAG